MAVEQTCPHCGKPVPVTALGGLCPECLIKAGAADTGELGPGGTVMSKPVRPIPRIEEIAPHFPQLEIIECLGRGGMGAVYKARQPRLDRFVALKILSRKRDSDIPDAEFAERFQREARALARLCHPSIVAVFDFGEAGGFHFLLMEFVDGLTLRQLLQTKKLSPEEALTIVPKICEALQFAHEQGIVHRDIKPENILLDKQGRVKIADFGIAKILGTESSGGNLTGVKDVIGTPHYMAPEQVEKPTTVDHRADIFSLGVVFYEMLTGELPLGKFASPSKKVQVDVRLDEVVLHALEKEPERRYQHASEVKTDVEMIVNSAGIGIPPVAPGAAATKPRNKLRFFDFSIGMPQTITEAGRWHFYWPGVLLLCATIGFVVVGFNLVIALALWLLNVSLPHGNAFINPGELWLWFVWLAFSAIGRLAALSLGAEKVVRASVSNSRSVRVLVVIVVAAAWACVLAGVAGWMRTTSTRVLGDGVTSGSYARVMVWVVLAVALSAYIYRRYLRGGNKPVTLPVSKSVIVARWTARILGSLLLVFYGVFILAEGLPPIASQPEGVQLNFVALGLMLVGFAVGWKHEGAAAVFIAAGWVLWHIAEGRMEWNLSQTPLPVAGLYAFCWWTTRGRRTGVVGWTAAALIMAFGLGRLLLPTSVFVLGRVVDGLTGQPVPNAELRLLPRPSRADQGDFPNARSGPDGQYRLYVGWYTADKPVMLTANGYPTLTTNLGPRDLGQRTLSRDFVLQPYSPQVAVVRPSPTTARPVVIETAPISGATGVDPALTELRVKFSKPVRGAALLFRWEEHPVPATIGPLRYVDDRTCVLPVRLQPGRVYALWLNTESQSTFRDHNDHPAVPYLLIFETRK